MAARIDTEYVSNSHEDSKKYRKFYKHDGHHLIQASRPDPTCLPSGPAHSAECIVEYLSLLSVHTKMSPPMTSRSVRVLAWYRDAVMIQLVLQA
jgi:hypothetical protein